MNTVFKLKVLSLSMLLTLTALFSATTATAAPHLNLAQTASPAPLLVEEGGGTAGTGGGDQYVADFISVVRNIIYPWLKMNSSRLSPSVDPEAFLATAKSLVSQKRITSAEQVYESCDGTKRGRAVEACYNKHTGMIYLSRTGDVQYRLGHENLSAKMKLVAHEVLRAMGLEGDNYLISNQIGEASLGFSEYAPVCADTLNTRSQWIRMQSFEIIRTEQFLAENCRLLSNRHQSVDELKWCEAEQTKQIVRRYLVESLSSCPN